MPVGGTSRGQTSAASEASEFDPVQFPDQAAESPPRWYMEGSAVFMETWMAGGLGRAQGGYDEMVFRAKIHDHTRVFSPLGLESEGT